MSIRLPLIRSGADERPLARWEWLFAPVVMPIVFLVLFIAAVVSVPVEVVYRIRQNQREKILPRDLAARGRVAEWREVEAEIAAGRGTLIVEHRSPKGPIREWWTADDVIASAPTVLPISLNSIRIGEPETAALTAYARDCATRYVDLKHGVAKLTQVPVPASRRFNPRKSVTVHLGGGLMTAILLVTGRELSIRYPQGKIVTLVSWFDEPILAVGDAEVVFLAAG